MCASHELDLGYVCDSQKTKKDEAKEECDEETQKNDTYQVRPADEVIDELDDELVSRKSKVMRGSIEK